MAKGLIAANRGFVMFRLRTKKHFGLPTIRQFVYF
jgi:hypothetical protein